jgi:uncharacterized protein with gpF-like domain
MTNEQRIELWYIFNRFQKSREKSYSPKINKALKAQVNQFLAAKKNGENDSDALLSVTSNDLHNVLKPLYMDAAITYGAKQLSYLRSNVKARMPIGFNRLMISLVNNYFLTELLNSVEDITAYTRERIRDILIAEYELGNGIDEITERIKELGFTYQRSRLIARTETVTAANVGAMLSIKTTNLKVNKVWISAHDNRTRRQPRDKFDHLHMDGIIVPYNNFFNVSGQNMQQPGDRTGGATSGNICNCRCTIGFIPIRDNNGRL